MNYIDYIVMAAFFAVLLLIPAISAMKSKSKGQMNISSQLAQCLGG